MSMRARLMALQSVLFISSWHFAVIGIAGFFITYLIVAGIAANKDTLRVAPELAPSDC